MRTIREVIEPKNAALNVSRNLKLPHSPGIRAGDLIFLSGMVSTDAQTGQRSLGTTAYETRTVLNNMQHMLESAGSGLSRAVKINVILADILEMENMNEVYREFFPHDPPARTVCAAQLSFGFKVEIECVALAGLEEGH